MDYRLKRILWSIPPAALAAAWAGLLTDGVGSVIWASMLGAAFSFAYSVPKWGPPDTPPLLIGSSLAPCEHAVRAEPVEVGEEREIVAWLCPTCFEEVPAPPVNLRREVSREALRVARSRSMREEFTEVVNEIAALSDEWSSGPTDLRGTSTMSDSERRRYRALIQKADAIRQEMIDREGLGNNAKPVYSGLTSPGERPGPAEEKP